MKEREEDGCHLPEVSSGSRKEDLSLRCSKFYEIIIYPSPKFGFVNWFSASLKLLWRPHFDVPSQAKFDLFGIIRRFSTFLEQSCKCISR